jgi:hypothetical protein
MIVVAACVDFRESTAAVCEAELLLSIPALDRAIGRRLPVTDTRYGLILQHAPLRL